MNMLKKIFAGRKEKNNKALKKIESELLKKDNKYHFFGYLYDEREIPCFVTELESEKNTSFREFVYVLTPKMLEHCVKNFTDDAILNESNNIEQFQHKCNIIAKNALYQEENWDEMIDCLTDYLKDREKVNDKIDL